MSRESITQNVRVLVVDDQSCNRKVINLQLARHGITVEEAEDGLEAVDLVKRNTYDAIFMDCLMPKMDGCAASRAIRAFEAEQALKPTIIIGLTASYLQTDLDACTESGMNECLTKPALPKAMVDALRRYLGDRVVSTPIRRTPSSRTRTLGTNRSPSASPLGTPSRRSRRLGSKRPSFHGIPSSPEPENGRDRILEHFARFKTPLCIFNASPFEPLWCNVSWYEMWECIDQGAWKEFAAMHCESDAHMHQRVQERQQEMWTSVTMPRGDSTKRILAHCRPFDFQGRTVVLCEQRVCKTRAEEELILQVHQLQDRSPAPLSLLGSDFSVVYQNQAASELYTKYFPRSRMLRTNLLQDLFGEKYEDVQSNLLLKRPFSGTQRLKRVCVESGSGSDSDTGQPWNESLPPLLHRIHVIPVIDHGRDLSMTMVVHENLALLHSLQVGDSTELREEINQYLHLQFQEKVLPSLKGIAEVGENLKSESDPEQIHKKLEALQTCLKQLRSTIAGLFKSSSLSFQQILVKEEVNVYSLVQSILDRVKEPTSPSSASQSWNEGSSQVSEIELVNEVPTDLMAFCDREKIASVFECLVSKSLKNREKGKVLVGVEKMKEKQQLQFSIKYMGIKKNDISSDKVDEKDTLSSLSIDDRARAEAGLSNAKRMVKAHNGSLWAHSGVSASAYYFSMEYLCGGSSPSTTEMHRLVSQMSDGGPIMDDKKDLSNVDASLLLLVDDDQGTSSLLQSILTREGFRVQQVWNEDECLKYLEQVQKGLAETPGLILLGALLRTVNSFQVCRQLKENAWAASIPVIMTSAKVESGCQVQGLSVDYDVSITPSFDSSCLLARIRAQLMMQHIWRRQLHQKEAPKLDPSQFDIGQDERGVLAKKHKSVSVVCIHLANFGALASCLSSAEVLAYLDTVYSGIDQLLDSHGALHFETGSGPYMAVLGHDGQENHTLRSLKLASEVLRFTRSLRLSAATTAQFRIGIDSGSAVGGLIGKDITCFYLLGDAVTGALDTQELGHPGLIQVSSHVYENLKNTNEFSFCEGARVRGTTDAKSYILEDPKDVQYTQYFDSQVGETTVESESTSNESTGGLVSGIIRFFFFDFSSRFVC